MNEEKTFKWEPRTTYIYDRWLLVYVETDRVVATVEKYMGVSREEALWITHYNGKSESFLTKKAAMKYAEDVVKAPEYKLSYPIHYEYKYVVPGKKMCNGCRGVGVILSMTDDPSTSGIPICKCSSCNGTGLHQEANDISACTGCKETGVKND